MPRTGLALLLSTAVTAAAGCGGGGGGGSTGGTGGNGNAASPQQFRAQVSRICTEGQKKIKAVPKPRSARAIVPYIDKTLAIARPYVDRLAAVNPPSNYAAKYKQIVSLNRQEMALLTRTKSALSGGGNPVQAIRKFQAQANKLSSAEDADWRQIGVPTCAS